MIICQQGLQTLVCLSKHLPDHQQGRAFFWSVHAQKQKTLVTNTKNVKLSGLIQEIKFRTSALVLNHQWNMSVGRHKCFILKTTIFQTLGFLICGHWEQILQSRPYWSSWNSIHECLKKTRTLGLPLAAAAWTQPPAVHLGCFLTQYARPWWPILLHLYCSFIAQRYVRSLLLA